MSSDTSTPMDLSSDTDSLIDQLDSPMDMSPTPQQVLPPAPIGPPRPGIRQAPIGPPRPGIRQAQQGLPQAPIGPPIPGIRQAQQGLPQAPIGPPRPGIRQAQQGLPQAPIGPQRPGIRQAPIGPPRPGIRPAQQGLQQPLIQNTNFQVQDMVNAIQSGKLKYISNRDHGVSSTLLYLGEINGIPVAAKIFPIVNPSIKCNDKQNFQGLEYEAQVYNKIVPNLAKKSPNFLTIYQLLYITNIMQSSSTILQYMIQELRRKSKTNCIFNTVGIIISPYIKHITLSEFINDKSIPDKDLHLRRIMAQIILSLVVMQMSGLMHNDLHSDNIMIKRLDRPETLVYNFNQLRFTIKNVTYKVYMFDWDHGYSPILQNNPKLNQSYLNDIGAKNRMNPIFDTYTILCTLYNNMNITPQFKKFVQDITGKTDGYLIALNKRLHEDSYNCRLPSIFDDHDITDWREAQEPYFSKYMFTNDDGTLTQKNNDIMYNNGINNFINVLKNPYFNGIIN